MRNKETRPENRDVMESSSISIIFQLHFPLMDRGSRSRKLQMIQCDFIPISSLRTGLDVVSSCNMWHVVELNLACAPPTHTPSSLHSFTWRTTEWSDCRVDLLLSQQDRRRSNLTGLCGGGLQTREVYCVEANAELLKYLNDLKDKDKGETWRRVKVGKRCVEFRHGRLEPGALAWHLWHRGVFR